MSARSPSTAAPPLWVWALSALAAAAVLAFSIPPFLAAEAESRPGHLRPWLHDAIARFAKEEPADAPLRVIAFGDSALGTAILQRPEMNESARGRGLDLDFLRLWVPFCVLDDVLPAMEAALAAKPDVVMIESWSVVYRIGGRGAEIHRAFQAERGIDSGTPLRWIADAPSMVLDHQAYLLDRLTGAPAGDREALPEARKVAMRGGRRNRGGQLQCNSATRRRMLRSIEARYPADTPLSIDPLLRQTLDALLDRAGERGIRLVFFDIPRGKPLEALPAIRQKRALTLDLLRQYAREGRAEYFEYSGEIADEETCDYVHFTAAGRERYLPWFVDRLASLRQARRR